MAFKDIQKGMGRRLATIRKTTSFSQVVIRIITSLYPRTNNGITQVIHEPKRRTVRIYTATKTAADRFSADRKLIHAALRREGLDVKKVDIRHS